jgi:hypothetical protein
MMLSSCSGIGSRRIMNWRSAQAKSVNIYGREVIFSRDKALS